MAQNSVSENPYESPVIRADMTQPTAAIRHRTPLISAVLLIGSLIFTPAVTMLCVSMAGGLIDGRIDEPIGYAVFGVVALISLLLWSAIPYCLYDIVQFFRGR
jgi:hypothetical protein